MVRPLTALLAAAALAGAALAGCLIEVPVGTLEDPPAVPNEKLDILLVVDNSGSMCEEQLALNEAFFGPDCPIQALNDPGPYLNPSPEVAAELDQSCGLAQMLAAYDVDFRLGIITTDVGPCDNRYGFAETQPLLNCRGDVVPWGRRPQRGCLQSAPTWDDPWLERGQGAFVRRLREGLLEIGTHGSPFERGLDAVDVFLDPAAARAPGCDRHAADFLRDDAHLVVVFATDEDDCSHGDGAFGLPDENDGESCSHATEEFYAVKDPALQPDRCYTERDSLAPVNGYAQRWLSRTRNELSVFVLGGVTPTPGGAQPLVATGCRSHESGTVLTQCFESYGASNLTGDGQPCGPDNGRDEECCTADGATRYVELANLIGNGAGATICGDFVGAFKRLQNLLVDPLAE